MSPPGWRRNRRSQVYTSAAQRRSPNTEKVNDVIVYLRFMWKSWTNPPTYGLSFHKCGKINRNFANFISGNIRRMWCHFKCLIVGYSNIRFHVIHRQYQIIITIWFVGISPPASQFIRFTYLCIGNTSFGFSVFSRGNIARNLISGVWTSPLAAGWISPKDIWSSGNFDE